ncbi:MAG: hypothetical protein EHM14_13450 [Methanothrix sp.]|nr:MAG: hypothetical protein EHM14_13450 [Methanothrix sp.]
MIKRYMILPMLLVLLLCTGLAPGQNATNNTSTKENTTTNVSAPAASAALPAGETSPVNDGTNSSASAGSTGNGTVENATSAGSTPNLNYIWSVSGIESGQITMSLSQDGQDLFGQAKYEPDSGQAWNAEVVGTVSGDKVDLTLTSQKENEMTTTKMSGTYANEGFGGNFTQVSGGKMVGKGTFSAMWINPDTSSYTPATIEQKKTETTASAETTTAAAPETTDSTNTTAKKSRFVDVREYKDKIGPGGDLSGVPPGMGGGF